MGPTCLYFPIALIKTQELKMRPTYLYFSIRPAYKNCSHCKWGPLIYIFPLHSLIKIENGTHLFIFFIGPNYKNFSHCKWDPLISIFRGNYLEKFKNWKWDPLIYIFSIGPTYKNCSHSEWDPFICFPVRLTNKNSKNENGTHLFIFFIGPTYKNSSHCKWDPLLSIFRGTYIDKFKNWKWDSLIYICP
jgi:hypothetical protein